jgi:hypothetical protein
MPTGSLLRPIEWPQITWRGVVVGVGVRGIGICRHDDSVIQHSAVARCRSTTDVCQTHHDGQRVDTLAPQKCM